MTSGPALAFGVLAALANLIGALAVARSARFGLRVIELFVAFGAGFMLALAMVAAVPEALAKDPAAAAPVILLGYLLVHLSQHTLTPHFHFGEETHEISAKASGAALVGLLLHTFFDGVAIASGFLVSKSLGVLFFVAIFLHKLPEGVTVSSLVIASGGTARRGYAAAALLGVATILGVLATARADVLQTYGLALAAGVTIYVGASNLVPEFQAKPGWGLPVAFFAGAGAFVFSQELLERVLG
ncbi:MAG: ZIP family metal transporter [Gemmatimonadetes bacterium]|nr:ZIP family metal transporter [Gemmatimonadota bacterium]